MPDANEQPGNPTLTVEPQNKQTKAEPILQAILETMCNSDVFSQVGEDIPSRFWSAYERVAKQHDDEYLERRNGQMDVLLIFTGLFSAVSSTFIVNMSSSLSPNPTDTTNSLLKVLINKIDNNTFSAQETSLPVWTGPSTATVWTMTFAYMSLSSSLLAAFGTVLAKQWLAHFKTTRFGKGALHERCQRRQKKFDALEAWHVNTIIFSLQIFLQLSLLFFGVALTANIWPQQHTVASVVMATTAFGLSFYLFTVVVSVKYPDCPLQTPISFGIQRALPVMEAFRRRVKKKREGNIKSWADFRDGLWESSRGILHTAHGLIIESITHFVVYLSRHLGALGQRFRSLAHDQQPVGGLELRVLEASGEARSGSDIAGGQSLAQDQEAAGSSAQPASGSAEEQLVSSEELDMSCLESSTTAQVHAVQSNAVRWILETSTDTEVITTAVRLTPEIEWPVGDITDVHDRLLGHFHTCFDPTGRILPHTQARAAACLKAMHHFEAERDLNDPLYIHPRGTASPKGDYATYDMLPDRDFLVVCAVINEYHHVPLDLSSLTPPDLMWMAHMLTFRLHKGNDKQAVIGFVQDFISTCLRPESSPRLVADCLLLAGQLIGLQIDRQHLARLDKSKAIKTVRKSVMNRALGLLLGEIPASHHRWDYNALKLMHALLQDSDKINYLLNDNPDMCCRALALCFCLLEDNLRAEADDQTQVRSRTIASLIRVFPMLWNPDDWYTSAQFDLLVDFHLRICEGTDSEAIRDTFMVLQWLNGSPSSDRIRNYIDVTIRFMAHEVTCHAALLAACAIPAVIVSVGQNDVSFRENFSTALALAILSDAPPRGPHNNYPFSDKSSFNHYRSRAYLKLLGILSQEPTWQPQLKQNGHLDNCLAIANTLSSEGDL